MTEQYKAKETRKRRKKEIRHIPRHERERKGC